MLDTIVNDLLTDTVDRFDPRVVHATIVDAADDLAHCDFLNAHGHTVTGVMARSEYWPSRTWARGERLVVVQMDAGPRPQLSLRSPELLRAALSGPVPEIRSGTVRVMGVARRAGQRSKVAVVSTCAGLDPVAACIGRSHARVDELSAVLGGEQIDIVAWHPDLSTYLSNALQPARVSQVRVDDETGYAVASAPGHQMPAAVGGGGLNSVLAGELTGLRVRIVADR